MIRCRILRTNYCFQPFSLPPLLSVLLLVSQILNKLISGTFPGVANQVFALKTKIIIFYVSYFPPTLAHLHVSEMSEISILFLFCNCSGSEKLERPSSWSRLRGTFFVTMQWNANRLATTTYYCYLLCNRTP